MSEQFTNLHLHSNFSFLDGLSRIKDIVDKSILLNQPAVCVTDHGGLFGLYELFSYAKKKGQKPIAGFEAYVTGDRFVKGRTSATDERAQSEANSKREHLVVLAKNNDGLKRLMRLCSMGWREGFYYRPRIDDQLIADVGTEGLVASSACFVRGTLVRTARGEVPIEEVVAGDQVFTHRGRWRRVTGTTTRLFNGNLLTFTTANGGVFTCTEDHPLLVADGVDGGRWAWARTVCPGTALLIPVEGDVFTHTLVIGVGVCSTAAHPLAVEARAEQRVGRPTSAPAVVPVEGCGDAEGGQLPSEVLDGPRRTVRVADAPPTEGPRQRCATPSTDRCVPVHCLVVADDHSFTLAGAEVAVHNCLAGRIPQALLRDDFEAAEREACHYAQLFPEGFWLEIQPTEMPEQVKVNKGVMEIAVKHGIPLLATTDAHYLNKEDKATHDVLLCMQSNDRIDNPDRWQFHGNTYFMMSRDECLESFTQAGHEQLDRRLVEQAVSETARVADLCNVELKTGVHYLPRIDVPTDDPDFTAWRRCRGVEGDASADYLRWLCVNGLQRRGLVKPEYLDRLELELRVITDMGFPDYFLIYEDIARYCRQVDLAMGPGRGCGRGDNLVRTARGTVRLDQVRVGDVVRTHTGADHPVTAVHEYAVDEELVTVEVEDGRRLTMTTDHKVLAVPSGAVEHAPRWIPMAELRPGDLLIDVCEEREDD